MNNRIVNAAAAWLTGLWLILSAQSVQAQSLTAQTVPKAVVDYIRAYQARTAAEEAEQTRANPAHSDARGFPILTVGNDPACDYTASTTSNGLQQAIDAADNDANGPGETEIRIANTGNYANRRYFINDLVDQTVRLTGGFANCAAASPVSGVRTVLRRGSATSGAVLLIDEISALQNVFLENLEFREGDNSSGGGVEIRNNNFVVMTNVWAADNDAGSGGGLSVTDLNDGTQTLLWMLDSNRVFENSAGAFGGGIVCSGTQASVLLDTDVSVNNNRAVFSGGGISLRSGCVLDMYASFPGGVYFNSAGSGGGVALSGGSRLNVIGGEQGFFGFGDQSRPTSVDRNSAVENGGGLFASGAGTLIRATDAVIEGNAADSDEDGIGDGGGVWLASGARLEVDRTLDADDCHQPLRCSALNDNTAVEGGAVYARGDGTSVDIRQSWINGNRARDFGAVLFSALGPGELPPDSLSVYLEGNVLVSNPLPGNGEVIELRFGNNADIVYNTFADNADSEFDAAVSIGTSNEVDFFGNVVSEVPSLVFSGVWNAPMFPNTGRSDCVVAQEVGSLPQTGPGTVVADALLDGDARPDGLSPAIDACSAAILPPAEPDIENIARGFDVVGISNGPGTLDIGAYEFEGIVVVDGGEVALDPVLFEAEETVGALSFTATRTGAANGALSVRALTVGGTAAPASDFVAVNQLLNWADGEVGPRTIHVTIVDDALAESTESFQLRLQLVSGTPTAIAPSAAIVTLFDNEAGIFADGFEGSASP